MANNVTDSSASATNVVTILKFSQEEGKKTPRESWLSFFEESVFDFAASKTAVLSVDHQYEQISPGRPFEIEIEIESDGTKSSLKDSNYEDSNASRSTARSSHI